MLLAMNEADAWQRQHPNFMVVLDVTLAWASVPECHLTP
jgi:hypothetical protein